MILTAQFEFGRQLLCTKAVNIVTIRADFRAWNQCPSLRLTH